MAPHEDAGPDAAQENGPVLGRRTLIGGAVVGGGLAALGLATAGPAFAAPVLYNPFAGRRVNQTWEQHGGRGIDFDMPVGTALPACGAGTVSYIANNGTAGHTVTIDHGGGWRSQYMHLSVFSLAGGTAVAQGRTVGLSGGAQGAPGSGASTGPHVHWHLINPQNVRVNPLLYVGGGGSTGIPKTTTVTTGEPGEVFYRRMQNWLRITNGYTGPVNGVPGTNTWAALQRAMRAYGYTGPINGIMGPNGWAAVQRLAAQYGYTGPVNGVMGPNSYKGFARFLNLDQWD